MGLHGFLIGFTMYKVSIKEKIFDVLTDATFALVKFIPLVPVVILPLLYILPNGLSNVQKTERGYACNYAYYLNLPEQEIKDELLPLLRSKEAELVKNTPEFQDVIKQTLSDREVSKCDYMVIEKIILELSNKKQLEQFASE